MQPIIRLIFISGIWPDTGFDLPDTGTENSRIFG
jgi:hypothetical protein